MCNYTQQNSATVPKAALAARKTRADLEEHMAGMGIAMRGRGEGGDMDDAEARGRSKSARGKKRTYDSSAGPAAEPRYVGHHAAGYRTNSS